MGTPLRVLIVEDSEDDTLLLVRALRRGGYDDLTFERVETPTAMGAALRERTWDIVISDYSMPYFSAPAALALLQESRLDLPFIILSGAVGDQAAVDAMRAGAHYFIPKGNLSRLIPSIERELQDAQVRRDRKRAAEALRESEEKYRTLFEQSTDAIFVTAHDGRFIDLNQAGLELLGCDRDELPELNARDLYLHTSDREDFQHEIEQNGFVKDYEVKLRKKDGTEMECVISSTVQRADDGTILRYYGIIRDLTGRKHLERQMRQQDRLAALGELAGGIAHDFNNVLMTVVLNAEMLVDDPSLPAELAPDVECILEEAREAAHLTRRILDFSRRTPMETRLLDMRIFMQESLDILRRTLPSSIQLLLDLGVGEHFVDADSSRVQQVVMNLVLNARDAMPEGGDLRIGLSKLQVREGEHPPVAAMDAGEWVCLSVTDTGTGMPPEVVAHLFEPFFTTKPKGQGTGLGLAQVYGIVGQHGGHIGLETEIGRGTTFRVYLPAREAKEAQEALEEEADAQAVRGNGEIVLIAEDEERVRKSCQRILRSLGYRVLTAANGREALDVYHSTERIDLLLTDMVMPEVGGKELIQELRKRSPGLKMVAMTGYALAEDLRELKEGGPLDVVRKPLDSKTLAQVVRHALDT